MNLPTVNKNYNIKPTRPFLNLQLKETRAHGKNDKY